MSLRALMQGPLPVTAPLVLNPLMARMAEAAGFPAGYLGGGATGYQKVALEANLNLTEMCQAAIDIGAVSSLRSVRSRAEIAWQQVTPSPSGIKNDRGCSS